ncbi:MAG: hypothetical protein ACP5N1_05645 [Candidatus Woesearchaeota archaeon]
MWEIERYIGNGKSSAFFRIRNNPSLGVKIMFNVEDDVAKNVLQTELDKARILKDMGVSVLNYNDVIQVNIPEHIKNTFDKSSDELASHMGKQKYDIMKAFFINHKNTVVWGLVMDYIPDDVIVLKLQKKKTLQSQKRIDYIYNTEIDKIELLGVVIEDSGSDTNIVWSESRAKLYFIDFVYWNFDLVGNKKYIEKIRSQQARRKRIKNIFAFFSRIFK